MEKHGKADVVGVNGSDKHEHLMVLYGWLGRVSLFETCFSPKKLVYTAVYMGVLLPTFCSS